MKALVTREYDQEIENRIRKAAKLYRMPISSNFSVIPNNWLNFTTPEGRRLNYKTLTTLWTLIRRANYVGEDSIEVDYDFLIHQACQGNCSQKSMSRYLADLVKIGVIQKELRHLFNSKKSLVIKIDFKKLNSLESSGLQKKVVDKSDRQFSQVLYKEENKIESKEILTPFTGGVSISKKEKSIKKKKIDSDNLQEKIESPPLEHKKSLLEDDFSAPAKGEVERHSHEQKKEKVRTEAVVVKGVFGNSNKSNNKVDKSVAKASAELSKAKILEIHDPPKLHQTTVLEPEEKKTEDAGDSIKTSRDHSDLRQEISKKIQKYFDFERSESLQTDLEIVNLSPDKVGLSLSNGIDSLTSEEKEILRKCIRAVYGQKVNIVVVPKPDNPKWTEWKNMLLSKLHHTVVDRVRIALDQVEFVELNGRKLKLKANYFACSVLSDSRSIIEAAASKCDVDVEIDNITDGDTLYFPWIRKSRELISLVHGGKHE